MVTKIISIDCLWMLVHQMAEVVYKCTLHYHRALVLCCFAWCHYIPILYAAAAAANGGGLFTVCCLHRSNGKKYMVIAVGIACCIQITMVFP